MGCPDSGWDQKSKSARALETPRSSVHRGATGRSADHRIRRLQLCSSSCRKKPPTLVGLEPNSRKTRSISSMELPAGASSRAPSSTSPLSIVSPCVFNADGEKRKVLIVTIVAPDGRTEPYPSTQRSTKSLRFIAPILGKTPAQVNARDIQNPTSHAFLHHFPLAEADVLLRPAIARGIPSSPSASNTDISSR